MNKNQQRLSGIPLHAAAALVLVAPPYSTILATVPALENRKYEQKTNRQSGTTIRDAVVLVSAATLYSRLLAYPIQKKNLMKTNKNKLVLLFVPQMYSCLFHHCTRYPLQLYLPRRRYVMNENK